MLHAAQAVQNASVADGLNDFATRPSPYIDARSGRRELEADVSRKIPDNVPTRSETQLLENLLAGQDRRIQVISEFGQILEETRIKNIAGVVPEAKLAHRKVVVLPCFLEEIATNPDPNVVNLLATGAVQLSTFQAGFAEDDLPEPPPGLDAGSERLAFWQWRRKAAIRSFAQKMAVSGDLAARLAKRSSEEARQIYAQVEAAKARNPHLNPPQPVLSPTTPGAAAEATLKKVPLSGSTPDIFSSEPFWVEHHAAVELAAFRDIKPLAVREGGGAVLSYPLVMAAIERGTGKPVFFVSAEIGLQSKTAFLCGFDGDGRHLNFGQWNPDSDADTFVMRAKEIIAPRFGRA